MKIKNHIRLLSALLVISSSMNVLADNSKTTEKRKIAILLILVEQ
ncbi:hypothetical protein [Proteus mirabilis]|nr:hypothetical protein [Proteus mirabilis]